MYVVNSHTHTCKLILSKLELNSHNGMWIHSSPVEIALTWVQPCKQTFVAGETIMRKHVRKDLCNDATYSYVCLVVVLVKAAAM